ncbi:sterol desaturase family protein [Hyalangium gracile]|uniref:sterol desaturase family protein n=1 Tax=Hyalangium gracile TaxID=394092 RepID=UPI001CCF078A|nr:sterol desaturase family protein [Hyalangium gracile]
MDTNDYYALLVPVFFLLMGIEAWAAKRQGKRAYVLPDTLSNLSCGMGSVLLGIFTGGFLLALYDGFQRTFGVVRWEEGSPVPWVLAFVGVDFCYYWFHRGSHAVGALWAIHVVHHQSEEMNISVALRQPWTSDISALLFFWPLPLLGVPMEAFFLAVGCLSLYEAMMHTRLIRRTGVWGWVFNTPSYHRLHHGKDPEYVDRNFGSTLIVWDRLFGTFVRETHEPTYGTPRALASWNPLWAQFQPFVELVRRTRRATSWRDAAKMWLKPPGWRAPGEVEVPESPARPPKDVPGWLAAYGVLQFLLLAVIGSALQWLGGGVGLVGAAVIVALVLWGTGTMGALFEGKPWAVRLELLRLGLSSVLTLLATARYEAAWLVPTAACFIVSGAALAVFSSKAAPRIARPPRA